MAAPACQLLLSSRLGVREFSPTQPSRICGRSALRVSCTRQVRILHTNASRVLVRSSTSSSGSLIESHGILSHDNTITTTQSDPDSASTVFHQLPSSQVVEALYLPAHHGKPSANQDESRPPLLFVHGSYHAAWCWECFWMPHFAGLGYDCYAVSLLGQGNSDVPEGPYAGTIQSHASDLSHFIRHVVGRPPVLIGHSFGGLIVQAYLADVAEGPPPPPPTCPSQGWSPPYYPLAAAALLCSVPPTGNMELVKRFIRERPIASIKITLSLAARAFEWSLSLCRDSFFSPAMSDEQVGIYQDLLKGSSKKPLFNLRELNASLPVAKPPPHAPPVLVMGAANDSIVDDVGLNETADFFGSSPVIIPGIAHDVMLDLEWQQAADALADWVGKQEALTASA